MTRPSTILFIIATGMIACPVRAEASEKPNVLLVAVDDLNDWVGCLGGHPQSRTPNIDRLANRGVLFTNAHCQAPICNPSRTSIMYGLRPSSTGVYGNAPNAARTLSFTSGQLSMPRHFAANGYQTFTTGKIYHGSALPPGDFHVVGPRPGQWNQLDERLVKDLPSTSKLWDFGPQRYAEKRFQDHVDASWAVEQIKRKHNKPFFITVGFYRPHVPFFSPIRVYNSTDLTDDLTLPRVNDDDWSDLPAAARELTMNLKNPPAHSWMKLNNNSRWREAVHAYLACIRWTDEQLGRLIDALDESEHADNTIIVFYSDHGFHLGEKLRWAKYSLWERSTRVPFIMSLPDGLRAKRCRRPVELLSIYPTLIELCKLSRNDSLEGVSLTPLLRDPDAEWVHPAITTLNRNNHTIRSQRWRYIRYADGSEELYDHDNDSDEWTNLASKPEFADAIARLKKDLPQINRPQIRSGKPPRQKKG